MRYAYDERHWYRTGWKQLCRHSWKLVRPMVEDLAEDLRQEGRAPEDAAQAFTDRIVGVIGGLIDGVIAGQTTGAEDGGGLHVSSSMWSYVLPLFGDTEQFRLAIVRDARLISGQTNRDITPDAAVGTLFRAHLNDARRKMSGGSPNRVKNWEAIQRISHQIIRRAPGTLEARLGTIEHLRAIQAQIAEQYPGNKNYNLSLGTLQSYFDEFALDTDSGADGVDVEDLAALSEETGIWPRFELCLDNLRRTAGDDWEAALIQHKINDIELMPQDAYQALKGISRYEFTKRCSRALEFLRECLSKSITFQLLRER